MPEPERDDGGDHPGQLCAVWGRGGRSEDQRLHGSTRMAAGSALGYWDNPTVATIYSAARHKMHSTSDRCVDSAAMPGRPCLRDLQVSFLLIGV